MTDCGSCSGGSCSEGPGKGLPPGMLEKYKLNTDRSDGFLVWVEIDRSGECARISDVTKEILSEVRSLNDGSRVWGVVFGHSELKPLYGEIHAYGVETLYEVHDRRLSEFHPEAYAEALAQIIIRTEPAAVLMGATPRGRELAPRTAALLDAGLTADCTGLSLRGRTLLMTRPAFGGNLLATIECTSFPQMATVRPGVFRNTGPSAGTEGTVIYWHFGGCGLKDIVSSEPMHGTEEDISKSRILISLGAGVKKESISAAESVARKLGGTVSCSRKLVEKGWFPQSRQVGQSGRCVSPDIYLAFGISGSVQHLAGISSAKKVIAVNTDPDAGIAAVADEMIIGDANAVLKELDSLLGE